MPRDLDESELRELEWCRLHCGRHWQMHRGTLQGVLPEAHSPGQQLGPQPRPGTGGNVTPLAQRRGWRMKQKRVWMNPTNAYMLVYCRKSALSTLMPPSPDMMKGAMKGAGLSAAMARFSLVLPSIILLPPTPPHFIMVVPRSSHCG